MAVTNKTNSKERLIRGQQESFDEFFDKIWNREMEYDKQPADKDGIWSLDRILKEINLLIDLYNGMRLEKTYNTFHMSAVKTLIVNLNNQMTGFNFKNGVSPDQKKQLEAAKKDLKKAEDDLAKRMHLENEPKR